MVSLKAQHLVQTKECSLGLSLVQMKGRSWALLLDRTLVLR